MAIRDYVNLETALPIQIDKIDDEWAGIDFRQQELNETISPDGSFAHLPPKFIEAFNDADTLISIHDAPPAVPQAKKGTPETLRDCTGSR